MSTRLGFTLAIGAALILAMPGQAAAAAHTYCVNQSGACPADQIDEGADLQTALMQAGANTGSTVLIGAGIYTRGGGFEYNAGSTEVTVSGAGAGQTIIQETAPFTKPVLTLDATGSSTLSGVTVDLTPGVQEGLSLAGATASGITIPEEPKPTTFPKGAVVFLGGTIAHSTVEGATAVAANDGGPATLEDDTLQGLTGLLVGGAETVTARDLRISGGSLMLVEGAGSSLTADGVLAVVTGSTTVTAVTASLGGSATVRSATIVNTGTGTNFGVGSLAISDHSSLTVSDSIVSGFPTAQRRSAAGTSPLADLTLNSDDIHLATDSGDPGTFTHNNDIDADPVFVNPATGDYHLRFGSPAIDAGGSCQETCQTIPDLDGLTRPIDGNGDGTATRDMGAYEYGRRAPSAAAAVVAQAGAAVTFSGTGSADPDDGDTLNYTWRFDDGTGASGPLVTHSFSTPGPHTATLTVTDPAGLGASAVTGVAIAPTALRDTTPPTISSLTLSPSTFAVAKGPTAKTAAARRGHPHKGTEIEFRLSEPAKVVIVFARRSAGIKVGRSCVARSHRHRHGRACTRYVGAGSLTRRSEPAGSVSFPFTGRVGRTALTPGLYRLAMTATDLSGNASKASRTTFAIVRG